MSSNTSTRTYNPNVRVGNWNEEICLEDDILKDFLCKQQNGTLLIQRTQSLMHTLLAKTDKTESETVNFGGNITLVNPGRELTEENEHMPKQLRNGRKSTSISINVDEWPIGGLETLVKEPMALSGAVSSEEVGCIRNTFKIVAPGHKDGEPLRYGEKFAMQSLLGAGEISKKMFIFSDRQRLGANNSCSRKLGPNVSPLQLTPVELESSIPYGAFFTVESYDPLLRMEHEGLPVPTKQPVLLKHCSTGQHVAVLDESDFRTPFGHELSLGAKTHYNSHKAECDNNYWIFQ